MEPHADLWWLPVGAGGHIVVHTSAWWEGLSAVREGRPSRPLFHAALEVFDGRDTWLVEMAPAWGGPPMPRGVVGTGPVGSRFLGRVRAFRYEVRCWRDGILPDRNHAVEAPHRIRLTEESASSLLEAVRTVPRLVWGRDVCGIADMWNSNSVIAWVLHRSGIDMVGLGPPTPGSAPGWRSGVVASLRAQTRGT